MFLADDLAICRLILRDRENSTKLNFVDVTPATNKQPTQLVPAPKQLQQLLSQRPELSTEEADPHPAGEKRPFLVTPDMHFIPSA